MCRRSWKSEQNRKYVQENDGKNRLIGVDPHPICELFKLLHHFFEIDNAHYNDDEKYCDAHILREAS
jgi:hypothetical protein